jgi:hypothetical protein
VSLTEDALATAFRTGLPFVGLRDHAHDPDLDRLIPPDAARAARAIPLTADDDRIRLAVADPDTDLSTLDKYLAGRQVDLALAPREEIDTILGPPPPPGEEAPEDLAHGGEAIATEAQGPGSLTEVDPEPERLAAAEDAEPTRATPSEPAPEPVGDTELPPEPVAAEPDPLAARLEIDGVAEPEPAAAEPTDAAGTEVEPGAEPDPFVAGPEVEPLTVEPDPFAAGAEAESAAEPEPVAAEGAATGEDAPSEAEPFAARAAPEPVAAVAPADGAALSDSDAELDGEVPSWLEPRRRRWWRVLLAVLLVLVVLAAAAVAVVALVNA